VVDIKRLMKGLLVAAILASLVAGCAVPTPQVVEREVVIEKEVPVTVVVEKQVVVEKPVVETVVVEKEVAAEAGPVALEVYNPTGALEVKQLFKDRLDTLDGKTICEMGSSWESDRTFPLIRTLLQNQFPTVSFVEYTEVPRWDVNAGQEMADAVLALGCDAVIVGNAG